MTRRTRASEYLAHRLDCPAWRRLISHGVVTDCICGLDELGPVIEVQRLGGHYEIAAELDVAYGTVQQWRNRHDDAPKPICVLSGTPIFDLDEWVEWDAARKSEENR